MSDADLLAAPGTPWEYQGRTYHLAAPDLQLELLFQAAHERWARNRLEATRGGVSPEAYEADLRAHQEARDANQFAFGGLLSLRFLLTPQGMAEYALLKLQAGAAARRELPPQRAWVEGLRRADPAAWDSLVKAVLEADFPNLLAGAGPAPSPAPATP